MNNPLGVDTDPWKWSQDQRADWLRRLGSELGKTFPADGEPNIDKTIYRLAETMKPNDSTGFGDSLVDFTNEAFYDLQRIIVSYRFTGGFGMLAGISVIDFNSDKLFVFELPVEDLGIDLALLSVVDRDDAKGIVQASNHLMERGWVPNHISIEKPITREIFKAAYRRGLSTGIEGDWDNLAIIMSGWGHELPRSTESEREELLEAYLNLALDE